MSLPAWCMVFAGRELVTVQRYQAGSRDKSCEIYPRSRVNDSASPAELPVGHFARPTSGAWWGIQQCMDPPTQFFSEVCDGAGVKNWPLDFKS